MPVSTRQRTAGSASSRRRADQSARLTAWRSTPSGSETMAARATPSRGRVTRMASASSAGSGNFAVAFSHGLILSSLEPGGHVAGRFSRQVRRQPHRLVEEETAGPSPSDCR